MAFATISSKSNPILTVVYTALLLLAILIPFTTYFLLDQKADAASTANFKAGTLISQTNFTNNNSMSASQIQNFLNQKNSTCLKNYKGLALIDANGNGQIEDWTTAERYGGSSGTQEMSAAQLIKAAANTYGINPQVFLVTLEKEQGLVTRGDCPQWRYNTAFGFGCPDTAPCDKAAYGFTRQLDNAAYHFKNYMTGKDVFGNIVYSTFKPGNRSILYHPNEACGSSTVGITNEATAALYTYTPYQPNNASLAAGYGTGNGCSSYGNRNFHLFYSDWFGNPLGQLLSASAISTTSQPYVGEPIKIQMAIANKSKINLNLGRLKAQAIRKSGGVLTSFSSHYDVRLAPGEYRVFEFTGQINQEGEYRIEIVRQDGGQWIGSSTAFQAFGENREMQIDERITLAPTIIQSLEMPDSSHQNSTTQATFTIKNNSTIYPVNIGRMKVEGKSPSGKQHDFPSTADNLTLAPNATYKYDETSLLPERGKYTFRLVNLQPRGEWSTVRPLSATSSIDRVSSVEVKQPVTVVESLQITPSGARINDALTATFAIKNFSESPVNVGRIKVEGRNQTGKQFDFPSTPDNLTIQPGQTYNYTATRALHEEGDYSFTLMNFRSKFRWSTTYPESEHGNIDRSQKIRIKQAVTVTQSLGVSPETRHANEPLSASFDITNHSTEPVNIGRMKVEAWHSDGSQYNFGSTPDNMIVQPGSVYKYSSERSLPKAGKYTIQLVNYRDNHGWSVSYPISENGDIVRRQQINVKNSVTVVEGLSLSSTSTSVGQNITAKFSLKNHGNVAVDIGRMKVEGRHSDGSQYDFPSTPSHLTIGPGEVYRYSAVRSLPRQGNFSFVLMNFREKERWSTNYPESEVSGIIRKVGITIQP